jgi:collagenase-like PrtC family protease
MKKVELLLPAGNEECLRAAVNNGANAIYLGLSRFSARASAGNFTEQNIASVINYCHERNVKVYVAFNTLVKNSELKEYFEQINIAYCAKADAVIIQDPCFVPILKKNFPGLKIHLSTQATTTNSYSVPDEVDRVILARELGFDEVKEISKKHETEIFVHGALCFSYSGQCLFSSIVGGRSGNRGRCAQPCRLKYNGKYPLSTMDLCLLEKLPEIISAGVIGLKIEGRMRTPLYVATTAKIYRKYIDQHYAGEFKIDNNDINELMIAFNREFTCGFGFTDTVIDDRKPMNRGLHLGQLKDGKIKLKHPLKLGDGVAFWMGDNIINEKVVCIHKDGCSVEEAYTDEIVSINDKKSKLDDVAVYKTHSVDMSVFLGEIIKPIKLNIKNLKLSLPELKKTENKDQPKLFVKVYDKKSAIETDKEGADVIYYDIFRLDCAEVKKSLKHAKLFVSTPRIVSDKQIAEIKRLLDAIKPAGVLVANRGVLSIAKGYDIHLDQSMNVFNDIDINDYDAVPIISPELNFNELRALNNRRIIVQVHGDMILMTTKEKLKAKALTDEDGRRFEIRENNGSHEILNCRQLGLFNKTKELMNAGFRYFYLNLSTDAGKFVNIYKKIINGEHFNDSKIRKGYTTGHFERGV